MCNITGCIIACAILYSTHNNFILKGMLPEKVCLKALYTSLSYLLDFDRLVNQVIKS